MSATFEVHDGCTTLISDAGRDRLAAEQRIYRAHKWHTDIAIGSGAGLIVVFAVLVVTKIHGG
jgi:hypothetical protein